MLHQDRPTAAIARGEARDPCLSPLHQRPTGPQAELVKSFAADITEVHELFEGARDAPILSSNAPPCAGAVAWVRGLKARLAEPFAKLQGMEHGALLEGREGLAAVAAYDKVMAEMEAFEAGVVEEWHQQVNWLTGQVGGGGYLSGMLTQHNRALLHAGHCCTTAQTLFQATLTPRLPDL